MIPHTCAYWSDALQLLKEKQFDIIFSDIQMPEMTGIELVKRIREARFDGAKTIPIIGFSADSQVSQTKYENAGFTDFLVKPFTAGQLIQTIYRYTGNETGKSPVIQEKARGFDALVEYAGDEEAAKKEILWSFVNENKKNYRMLEKAFANDDWETIRNVSHKMLPLIKIISFGQLVPLMEKYSTGSRDKENQTLFLGMIKDCIQEATQFINHNLK
jgi:CheY-like chemotaxis protein